MIEVICNMHTIMDLTFLKNKKILIGITGSIATYKTPQLAREFIKSGAEVRIVATPAAAEFVSFQVLENLTLHPVVSDIFDKRMQGKGAWHVELAHWADIMLIAPCSATSLSKIVTGNCDNALSCLAVALPRKTPLVVSPAMDFTMYENPATQRNIIMLAKDGVHIILPDEGELASGLKGKGRLPEFNTVLNAVIRILQGEKLIFFNNSTENALSNMDKIQNTIYGTLENAITKDKWNAEFNFELLKNTANLAWLNGKRILISAGATQEKIDDVRYISNYSTGKMGYALAKIAMQNGAKVTLVSGKTNIPQPDVTHFISIASAEEMYTACVDAYANCDIAIMAAAVADFTPEIRYHGKIKKQDLSGDYSIKLIKTKDILLELGKQKNTQFLVGFALEAEDEIENARKKLYGKNCDMIVLNSANKEDSGFGSNKNTITIINKNNSIAEYPAMEKEKCAVKIYENIFINL